MKRRPKVGRAFMGLHLNGRRPFVRFDVNPTDTRVPRPRVVQVACRYWCLNRSIRFLAFSPRKTPPQSRSSRKFAWTTWCYIALAICGTGFTLGTRPNRLGMTGDIASEPR